MFADHYAVCVAANGDDSGMLMAVHQFISESRTLDLAIIIYMSAPATFSMQAFVKGSDASAYVSTTNVLYCFISVVVYALAASL